MLPCHPPYAFDGHGQHRAFMAVPCRWGLPSIGRELAAMASPGEAPVGALTATLQAVKEAARSTPNRWDI